MKITTAIAPFIGASIILASSGLALAQTGISVDTTASANAGATGAGASVDVQARITKGKDRADQEIKRRVSMLNELSAKVQAMTHVSASEKGSVAAVVSTEITDLTNLQTKIDADVDIATLRTDIHSIALSYRIFMLVIPRARIDVAADKVGTASAALSTLAGKLQTRITSTTGDTSSMTSAIADMNAKIADSKVQADAAVAAVAGLQPDNGDKTVEASNTAAIKDARGKIQAALADLKAARQDAHTIVQGLHALGAGANASVHAAAEASSSAQ